MNEDPQLFDTTLFGGPPKRPVHRDQSPKTPDSVAVSGVRWNGTSKTTPGLMHFVIGRAEVKERGITISAIVSACGLVVVPHTFDPDEERLGCVACAQRSKGLGAA